MWTPQNRKRYDRSRLRYPSDLTDEEWAHVVPVIPPAKPGGNKRTVDVREVMNGVMYVLSTGCQWRALPKDLPPKSTVHDYLILWSCDGTLDRIHHALYVACREQAEREASPTAAIIDSQSVKSAEKGGPAWTRSPSSAGGVTAAASCWLQAGYRRSGGRDENSATDPPGGWTDRLGMDGNAWPSGCVQYSNKVCLPRLQRRGRPAGLAGRSKLRPHHC